MSVRGFGQGRRPGQGFGFAGQGGEGDLGGVKELGSHFVLEGSQEYAVAGAGDEVADVVIAGERRHGEAVGFGGAALGGVYVSGFLERRGVNLLPGLGAVGDGGVVEGGMKGCFRVFGDGRRDGLDHGGSSGAGFSDRGFYCAPKRGNSLQTGWAGISPLGSGGWGGICRGSVDAGRPIVTNRPFDRCIVIVQSSNVPERWRLDCGSVY